ncbi:MAG TPA: HD domain-containing phosphohydrolase [Longimicrobiaceae bacterium]|nr:HD domain-containing phosphohydrolase [Longimicrobiaceae bacterium]
MTEQSGTEPGRILVVDDDESVLRTCARILSGEGHLVDTATSVADGVERVAAGFYDVVVTDMIFPGGSGVDLMVEVRSRAPEARLILMTGHADLNAAADAVVHGIDRLLLKPFSLHELRAAVRASMERRHAARRAEREREMLEARLRQRDTESKIWILRAAHALAHAVEAKDPYTAGHARRVTAYAMTIAEITGDVDLLSFRLAGDLHDVGKIGVPDRVLSKPARLTRREFEQVKKHPAIGARILTPLIDDPLVLSVVRHHHERWDGAGYPDGLAGHAIPFAARVLAVADTLDAMTSARAYRDEIPWDTAVASIRGFAGHQFDPHVVGAFEQGLPLLREHFLQFRHARPEPVPAA